MRTTTPSKHLVDRPAIVATSAVAFLLPLLGLAIVCYLWRPPTVSEVVVSLLLYAFAGFGISLGWHRLFTHKGFTCSKALSRILALAGSLAFEGSLASWVANHRAHHAHTDKPGDPHSPWVSPSGSTLRGFLHAHVGWLFAAGAPVSLAKDIEADQVLRKVSRFWWAASLTGLLLPAFVAGIFGGWDSFMGMLAFAGILRVVLFHHVTWSVNSICHMYGARPFATKDRSGNVAWLALLSFGESWHNNHHAAPRAARHGVIRGQLDLTAMLLALLERLGLVRAVLWPDRLPRRR